MTAVVPLAKDRYDRREEQLFREWSRRNIQNAENIASNASTAAGAVAAALSFANLEVYADDTAAGVGGLTQGTIYRTATGALMVKL